MINRWCVHPRQQFHHLYAHACTFEKSSGAIANTCAIHVFHRNGSSRSERNAMYKMTVSRSLVKAVRRAYLIKTAGRSKARLARFCVAFVASFPPLFHLPLFGLGIDRLFGNGSDSALDIRMGCVVAPRFFLKLKKKRQALGRSHIVK